jgi:uncharacterized protein YcfL
MRWWLLGALVLLLVGCGSSTTVVTVVVTVPPGTPTPNAAATATRAVELNQLATALAPTPQPTATAPRPANTPVSAATNPPATPTAPPAVALKVVDQGFGQNGRGIGYAFIVENPDPKLAVDFSQYRVSAFDAAGQVMRTEASYIPVIFPGQRIGIAGEFAIAQDARIANVDFAVTPGRPRPFDGQSPLTTGSVALQGNPDTGEIVTGVVNNAYAQELRNVVVYAVAYDARGVIVGGGQKNVDRVAGAGGQAPVDVTITTTTLPARVELYAAFAY